MIPILIGLVLILTLVDVWQLAALHKINDGLRDLAELLEQIRENTAKSSDSTKDRALAFIF